MKQTAIEWLFEQVWITSGEDLPELLEQAKEMEKLQIIDAYEEGMDYDFKDNGEQYYNETFKQDER
jgi:hypothetical protein